jgi:hypothetical protein
MLAVIALAAQAMVSGAGPTAEARPATEWSCNFNDAEGSAFELHGKFAEAPAGSDPNNGFDTVVEGSGPAPLVGATRVNAFASYPELRSYQVSAYAKDGSSYVTTFGFMQGEELGLATVTRYVPDPVTKRGTLRAFATGHCRATFLPATQGAGQ